MRTYTNCDSLESNNSHCVFRFQFAHTHELRLSRNGGASPRPQFQFTHTHGLRPVTGGIRRRRPSFNSRTHMSCDGSSPHTVFCNTFSPFSANPISIPRKPTIFGRNPRCELAVRRNCPSEATLSSTAVRSGHLLNSCKHGFLRLGQSVPIRLKHTSHCWNSFVPSGNWALNIPLSRRTRSVYHITASLSRAHAAQKRNFSNSAEVLPCRSCPRTSQHTPCPRLSS